MAPERIIDSSELSSRTSEIAAAYRQPVAPETRDKRSLRRIEGMVFAAALAGGIARPPRLVSVAKRPVFAGTDQLSR